jgi:flagellar biosynthesis/type III secretory pathway chaperone
MADRDLQQAIAAEAAGLDALAAVLAQETSALCACDVAAVERTAARKLELVRDIERLGAARRALAARAGDAAAVAPELAALAASAVEANRVNALNGRLIDRHQQYVARSLAALRGAAGSAPVYGPDGQAPLAVTSRPRALA